MTDLFQNFGFGDALPEGPVPPDPTYQLYVELVPKTSWGSNLRSALSRKDWDTLRKQAYLLAGHRCEICGGKGRKHPVEAHEVWDYNGKTHVQTLERLIALCPNCHEVKHFGRAQAIGRGQQACVHLMAVNGWSADQASGHLNIAFSKWADRSQHEWELDLSWLADHGIAIPEPPKR